MVVAIEFIDSLSTIYNARDIWHYILHSIHDGISTKHFPLSESLINKESSKSIYNLSVKAKKREKKDSEIALQ